jgi:uncharacterized protein YdeI (YjbR/CyaY-like superfamily)
VTRSSDVARLHCRAYPRRPKATASSACWVALIKADFALLQAVCKIGDDLKDTGRGAGMEMAYREQWKAEIAEMRRVLAGFPMKEECKWGKPTYTVDGKNVVIMQGFKEYFGLGFLQGALLKDPEKVLVQLGRVHAGRVMKFTSVKDITAQAATIRAYVQEAIAVEKAGLRMKQRKTSDLPVPEELTERFRRDPRLKRAFEALTPGRQRSYLYHFTAAKQSATRVARIEEASPAILEGRGFLERR